MQGNRRARITGHVQVKDGARGRKWHAFVTDATGAKSQKVLGPAWVKDTGRRTARGATIWRAADGPKPDGSYLTPKEAEDRLRELLSAAPKNGAVRQPRRTFGDACEEWLRYVEHDRQRA